MSQFFSSSLGQALERSMRSFTPASGGAYILCADPFLLAPDPAVLLPCPQVQQYVLRCLPALRQEHLLMAFPEDRPVSRGLLELAESLAKAQEFYDAIGGLVGYQFKSLSLIRGEQEEVCARGASQVELSFHIPRGPDLSTEEGHKLAQKEALEGLAALPRCGQGRSARAPISTRSARQRLPFPVHPQDGRDLSTGGGRGPSGSHGRADRGASSYSHAPLLRYVAAASGPGRPSPCSGLTPACRALSRRPLLARVPGP